MRPVDLYILRSVARGKTQGDLTLEIKYKPPTISVAWNKLKKLGLIVAVFLSFGFSISKIELGSVLSDADSKYEVTTDDEIFRFVHHFPGNRLMMAEVHFINEICRSENQPVLDVLARAQGEQGIIVNLDPKFYEWRRDRFFSYGLVIKDARGNCPFLGFSNQVTNAIHRMREFMDEWKPGSVAHVDFYGNVECKNSATYALHRYNCRWGAASNMGVYNEGNSIFIKILAEFRTIWLSLAGSK